MVTDQFPANISIEIDRPQLRRYLRTQYFWLWILVLSLPGIGFGAIFGLDGIAKAVERGDWSWFNCVLIFLPRFSAVAFGAILVGVLCYRLFSHREAARFADTIALDVEAQFLRIRQRRAGAQVDRKVHFRSIVDYSTVQDWLMRRYGVHELQMSTTAGANSMIKVVGVKDCLKIRDLLAEIDRLRENN